MSVSVIITCHNEERFIRQAIDSVVGQTSYDEVEEIIVVEDGSRDSSGAILDQMASANTKIKVLGTGGVGVSAARNLAIEQAKGDFIAFLDGDDLWTPGKLERQLVSARDVGEKGVLFYTDFLDFFGDRTDEGLHVPVRVFDAGNARVLEEFFVHDGPIIPSSALIRTNAIHATKGFDPELRYAEDTDAWLRLAAAGGRFQHVPGILTLKRRHGANATGELEGWDDIAEHVSLIWSERVPALKRLVHRRASVRRVKIASSYLSRNDRVHALTYLKRALRSYPFNGRAYLFIFLVVMPGGVRTNMISALKTLRALGRRNRFAKIR